MSTACDIIFVSLYISLYGSFGFAPASAAVMSKQCSYAQMSGFLHIHCIFVGGHPCAAILPQSISNSLQQAAGSCRWFDNTLFTMFRGKRCYDGGLTNFIPLPPTQHGVRVCCFPSKQISVVYDIGISPDNYEEWPHSLQEMLSWAFEPASDKLLVEFIGKSVPCRTVLC